MDVHEGAAWLVIATATTGIVALLKGLIPLDFDSERLKKWVPLMTAAAATVLMVIAVQSGQLPAVQTMWDTVVTWIGLVSSATGIRALATTPMVNGKTLSDLPSKV